MIEVVFLEDVKNYQSREHVNHHVGYIENIEKYERPNFESRLNSKLKRKISKLNLFVKL